MPEQDHPRWQIMIAGLVTKTDALVDVIGELAASTRDQTKALVDYSATVGRAIRVVLAVFVVLVMLIGGVGWVGWSNHRLGQREAEIGARLTDCTTPSTPTDRHECYDRSQQATADAITRIITAICVIVFPDEKATQRCVTATLRRSS